MSDAAFIDYGEPDVPVSHGLDAAGWQAFAIGLGLAIALEVAQAHGGELTIATSDLGGAQFTLTLPLQPN